MMRLLLTSLNSGSQPCSTGLNLPDISCRNRRHTDAPSCADSRAVGLKSFREFAPQSDTPSCVFDFLWSVEKSCAGPLAICEANASNKWDFQLCRPHCPRPNL